MTEQQVKEFVSSISGLNWTMNHQQFCEILGFNNDFYSQDKFLEFQELSKALNKFDVKSLTKLVNAYPHKSVSSH